MSENNDYDTNDESSINHWRRRGILAALAGSLGVGGYLNRYALRNRAKKNSYREGNGAIVETEKSPPRSEAEADPSGPHFPWEKDTVTVTAVYSHFGPFNRDYRVPGIENAISFWNDYISENTDETLTLTFEANASNPDIEITTSQEIQTTDETQYVLPSTNTKGLQPYVRVETLTENPVTSKETNGSGEDLPVRGEVTVCGGSPVIYEHVMKHVLGRLIGYEIWSEPVNVMTPKNLFGVSPEYGQMVDDVFVGMDSMWTETMNSLADKASELTSTLSDAEPFETPDAIRLGKDGIKHELDFFKQVMDEHFIGVIEQAMENHPDYIDLSNYIGAYQETVASGEIAHLEETVSLFDELLSEIETVDNAEIRDLENYNTLIERLGTMQEWPLNEDFSMRVHQHATDAYWSEYNWSENTPEDSSWL